MTLTSKKETHQKNDYTLYSFSILYLAFIIFGSTVPFNYVDVPLEAAIASFYEMWNAPLTFNNRSDWFVNFLLFIPLSYSISAIIRNSGTTVRLIASITIVAIAFLFCSAIEFAQLYLQGRVSSVNDIYAETLGAAFGILLFWITQKRFERWMNRLRSSISHDRKSAAFHAFVTLFFAYNLMPLDLTVSPGELFNKWQDGKILFLPFSGQYNAYYLYGVTTDFVIWFAITIGLIQLTGLRPKRAFVTTVYFAAALEVMQLFILSRFTDSTDIIIAALAGGIAAQLVRSWQGKSIDIKEDILHSNLFTWGLLVLWVTVMLFAYMYPLQLIDSRVQLQTKLAALTAVPFVHYWQESPYEAVTQILRKSLMAMPLGYLLYRLAHGAGWILKTALLAFGFSIIIGLESLQLLLANKVASTTDVLLALVGFVIGIKIYKLIHIEPVSFEQREQTLPKSKVRFGIGQPLILGAFFWISVITILYMVHDNPRLPYNIRELYTSYVFLSSVLIASTLFWLFGGIQTLFSSLEKHEKLNPKTCLLAYVFHLVTAWLLVRVTFPRESLHDILGNPVWGALPELELAIRFFGLFGIFSGIMTYVHLTYISRSTPHYLTRVSIHVFMLFYALFVLPVGYTVTVLLAGTDNLVELLPNYGYSPRLLFLLAMFILTSITATIISHTLSKKQWGFFFIAVIAIALLLPLNFYLTQHGLEQFVNKYGKTFSATAFLLSPDRDSLVGESALLVRFCLFNVILIVFMSMSQMTGTALLGKKR